jgi:hypothetical protein
MTSVSFQSNSFSANKPGGVDPRTRDISLLKSAGASSDQLSSIKDRASAEALAAQLGISLPELPAPPSGGQDGIFNGQGGEMSQMGGPGGAAPSGPPAEIVSALKAGGATDVQIAAIDGPQAAQALAAELGVTLPQPPAPSTQGGKMNQLA